MPGLNLIFKSPINLIKTGSVSWDVHYLSKDLELPIFLYVNIDSLSPVKEHLKLTKVSSKLPKLKTMFTSPKQTFSFI